MFFNLKIFKIYSIFNTRAKKTSMVKDSLAVVEIKYACSYYRSFLNNTMSDLLYL